VRHAFLFNFVIKNTLYLCTVRQLTVFLWNISDVSTIVSHGAVFRALNKENGPERTIMASFGLLQDERYNDKFEGHALHYITQGTMDPAEGWATNVIEWLIKTVYYPLLPASWLHFSFSTPAN
jgi:hypothetical protein